MKTALKYIGGFLAGALLGFGGMMVVITLFSGESFDDFVSKLAATNTWEVAGVLLLSILLLPLVLFLQVILHEGGHLLCGLACGYRFVSFRIFNLTFIRIGGKLRIKRFGVAGTGGQCLLTPPERPLEEIPTLLYNAGGVLANLLTALIALVPLLCIDEMPSAVEFGLILFVVIGLIMALMNGIPMKIGGIGNDADNMRLLLKNKQSKQALVTQLRVNALTQEGMRPKDMPEEWFRPMEDTDYKDALQATLPLMYIARLQDRLEWEAAYEALQQMMLHETELIGLLVLEAKCEQLFLALVTGRREEAEKLYTDKLKKYIEQYKNVMSSKQRILCAVALHLERDTAKAKEIYDTVCRQGKKYLMQGELLSDIAQMEAILLAENLLPEPTAR